MLLIKKIICFFMTAFLLLSTYTYKINGEECDLYAISACLMDGANGRVLYEKNGYEVRSMASTTKIMTCIIAIENGNLEDIVEVSRYAASMPDVQLNIREGEKYKLRDLLYSLMLESHNDVAVAIAEHIGGSVGGFATLMNDKARNLGCYETYFITPNGLDGADENTGRFHSTNAVELGRIMSYCIRNETFLEITRTKSYSFKDIKGKRSFTVNNKNQFLNMMEGALSGKTGFTGLAGYCYVGALRRDNKDFVVSLLGCGWPNNKNYKWSDTKELMEYGINNFEKVNVTSNDIDLPVVSVNNGVEDSVVATLDREDFSLLLGKNEQLEYNIEINSVVDAPVTEGQLLGKITYYVGEDKVKVYNIFAEKSVKKIDFKYCFQKIFKSFFI